MAFADPLGVCRFETGDALYDSKIAYQMPWEEASALLRYGIQVKSPSRTFRIKPEQTHQSVFADNWRQQVILEFTQYPSRKSRMITTTQGRLYSFLRFGDQNQLEGDSSEPPLPKLAQALLGDLEKLAKVVVGESKNQFVFVIPYDQTGAILRSKKSKMEAVLGKNCRFEVQRFELADVDPILSNEYTATSELLCFWIEMSTLEAVEGVLKKALHTPAKKKLTDRELFDLNNHGLLVST